VTIGGNCLTESTSVFIPCHIIIGLIKLNSMNLSGHVTHMVKEINTYGVLVRTICWKATQVWLGTGIRLIWLMTDTCGWTLVCRVMNCLIKRNVCVVL
jgi:hypothetical protein